MIRRSLFGRIIIRNPQNRDTTGIVRKLPARDRRCAPGVAEHIYWRDGLIVAMQAEVSLTHSKILIVSYLFPPVGGIGVQRALSLAKYLPACGYEVHVLKATNAGGPVYDPDLVRQIPSFVKVHTAFTPEIPFAIRQKLWAMLATSKNLNRKVARNTAARISWKRYLIGLGKRALSPEPEILWVPFALRKARQIIKRHDIKFVLITVPPFSALVLGTALKREFPSLLLVSDFRDEWLSFYLKDFEFQNSEHTRRRAETIEREAVESSDLVVAVNRSSCAEIRHRYPGQPDSKFAVIPNGYDADVFASFQPRPHASARMVVTHVGTVYKTASPRFYLDALDGLPEETRSQIETRFVGRVADSEQALLEGRRADIKILGFMPQHDALKFMEETDFLLLTMTNEISVPGKLYEYMATRKPILAIAPAGSEVDQVLRETNTGLWASPGDKAGIQSMLVRAFEAWSKGQAVITATTEAVCRYERRILVEEYGRMMWGLDSRPQGGAP